MLRDDRLIAGVEEQEAPGAVGILGLAGPQAPVAQQGALLITNHLCPRTG